MSEVSRRFLTGLSSLLCLIFLFTAPVHAQWSHDQSTNLPLLVDDDFYSRGLTSISDGAGGVISLWWDHYSSSLRSQRVTGDGYRLWGSYGRSLNSVGAYDEDANPRAVGDGAGGFFLAWSQLSGSSRLVMVQHYDAGGNPLWGENGVGVTYFNLSGVQQTYPVIDMDGAGGVVVGWINEYQGSHDIIAQRLDSPGSRMWTNGGKVASNATTPKAGLDLDCGDAPGETFLAWQEWVDDSNWDLETQRLSPEGDSYWLTDDERSLARGTADQVAPRIAHYGDHNMLAVWTTGEGSASRVNYQRKLGNGDSGVYSDAGGTFGCLFDYQDDPRLVESALGGLFVVYREQSESNAGRYVAHLVPADYYPSSGRYGETLYEYSQRKLGKAAFLADETGGLYGIWEECEFSNTLLVDHFDRFGDSTWSQGPVRFGFSLLGYQTGLSLVPGPSGGAIASWYGDQLDYRRDRPLAQLIDHNGYLGDNSFALQEAVDRPNDQGGEVALSWDASPIDVSGTQAISSYSLWIRQLDKATGAVAQLPAEAGLADDDLGGLLRMNTADVTAFKSAGWTFAGQVPAVLAPEYTAFCPTYGDSSVYGVVETEFKVVAHHQDSGVFWECSGFLSGHSVDNLAPGAPLNLAGNSGGGSVDLAWTASGHHDEDLAVYRIYRGDAGGFPLDEAHLLGESGTTSYQDTTPTGRVYYRVTAVDAHGNESEASGEIAVATSATPAGGAPLVFAHRGNYPNPFNPQTSIRFDLPNAARVRVTVYDAAGRLVTVLVDESMATGTHQVRWNGQDASGQAMASGVYFSRIEAAGFTATRSMTLVR